jgi:Cellobiohydrolase A (1,4-beta-cellobiosidase A)
VNSWGSGYQMNVTVSNNGSGSISGWTLALNFDEDPQLTGGWNASISQSGNTISASNISWNGNLASGQSTSFGFQGNSDGSLSTPSCTVQ